MGASGTVIDFERSVDLHSFETNLLKPSMVVVRGSAADWSWWSIGGGRWSVVSGQ